MKIVCIGSGNVATHMAIALKEVGAEIIQVYSRNHQNAEILAALTRAKAISRWEDLNRQADCYLIAVKDEVIASVAAQLIGLKGLVVHTSGATSLSSLSLLGKGYGVLYPLQTFSRTKAVDLKKVPLCIEGDSPESLERISAIAHLISPLVSEVDSAQRTILHVAAVFACNFSNHLYHLSAEILAAHQLEFDLLKPLIMETAKKIQNSNPADVQTGPAIRNDVDTMKKHLSLLQDKPALQEIYTLLSNSIKNT
ncbi:Rossmann-like and DUF2520 domain-containing protein [Pedobacter sp. AW31-3R]|uniref:Rossmann-like and DUF2520 domain-containing protein n=1 Tax=Pedobacter sp. AW31-3R TaxID=3445781 RepID=UPI003FA11A83